MRRQRPGARVLTRPRKVLRTLFCGREQDGNGLLPKLLPNETGRDGVRRPSPVKTADIFGVRSGQERLGCECGTEFGDRCSSQLSYTPKGRAAASACRRRLYSDGGRRSTAHADTPLLRPVGKCSAGRQPGGDLPAHVGEQPFDRVVREHAGRAHVELVAALSHEAGLRV